MSEINSAGSAIFKRVTKLAQTRQLNLIQIAKLAGFKSDSILYKYRQGVMPSDTAIVALASVLGTSFKYLKYGHVDLPNFTSEIMDIDLPKRKKTYILRALKHIAQDAVDTISAVSRFAGFRNISENFTGDIRMMPNCTRDNETLTVHSETSDFSLEISLYRDDAVLCEFISHVDNRNLNKLVLRYSLDERYLNTLKDYLEELRANKCIDSTLINFDLANAVIYADATFISNHNIESLY